MAGKRLFRFAPHEHADPARRVTAAGELPPDSGELAALLAGDPVPEVRVAAANRCADLAALAAAWEREADPAVRAALALSLGTVLAETQDGAKASAFIDVDECTDAIRVEVARRAADAERRRGAIAAVRDESALLELALHAEHAETRIAAAERVHTPEALRRLADAARNKDKGVARLARTRIDAMENHEARAAEADAILEQLEALATKPGPILTAVIELNRRWQALDLRDDAARLARCDAARSALQTRFDREHEEQRLRTRFERGLNEWLARADAPATAEALAVALSELAALREDARKLVDSAALAKLDEADQRIERWTRELEALAGAEALVVEAEELAAGTSIDNAKLPERWEALDRRTRTPALTRRFEAALILIEERRLAQVRAAEHETQTARLLLHNLLHTAEQALAAGQLHAARAAAEEIRARKADAGALPKPTIQRLSRVVQQLTELERWESFGQHHARVQLCERAEAPALLTLDPARIAAEVQKLRGEWQALDKQHADVPKSLRDRFEHACAKAYAPAARHFAEQAALRKQARKQRDEFIEASAAQASTLLAEPRDWRAIERFLRETHHKWQDGDLGSVEAKAWKSIDARFRAGLAPLHDALAAARDEAKARRATLIDEVKALAPKATDRDTPAQVKAIQARWQAQAKELTLPQRDDRALWEQFRAACDAIFEARDAKRKERDGAKHEGRRALEAICAELEQLAQSADRDEGDLRRALRDLSSQWKEKARAPDPALRGVESRFAKAKAAVEAALSTRARARESAVWQTLAAKERLCETLDRLVVSLDGAADPANVSEQWTTLPELPPAWEKSMAARRDAALAALESEAATAAHRARIESGAESRREMLLELEMQLGLETPPELKAQRLALQVKKLRDRFQSAATISTSAPGERLVEWCAQPGVADFMDRERCGRVVASMGSARR
jgi:exonuclease SbcC